MNKTKTLILVQLLFGIFFFVLLWKYASWSSSDGTPMEPFLKLGLSSIALSLFALSFTHKKGDMVMIENKFKIPFVIRLRHLDRIVAYLFIGVLAFGVNELKFWHFFFIILAAGGLFLRTVLYAKTRLEKTISIVFMIFASFVWLIAFLFPFLINVSTAELIFYAVSSVYN